MKHININQIIFSCLFFLQLSCLIFADERKLTVVLNPDCDIDECKTTSYDNRTFSNLVYVRSDSKDDSIHYLLSTIKSFTVLIVRTSLTAKLDVTWNNLIHSTNVSNAINFTEPYKKFSSLDVTKILEYNDKNDTANPSKIQGNNTLVYLPSDLLWEKAQIESDSSSASITFPTSYDSEFLGNNTFRLKVSVYTRGGRPKQAPKLLHNSNDVQLEVFLDNAPHQHDNSRFALELALLTDQPTETTNKLKKSKSKSLDDEFTPGVFSVVSLTSPKDHTYLQWKPVVYTDTSRTVETLTSARDYDILNVVNVSAELSNSLAYKYLSSDIDQHLCGTFNVSFGEQKDGYYDDAKYQTWVMTMGSGNPPSDKVSVTVILVLAIGLGLPVIFVIVGSIFLVYLNIVKKRKLTEEAAYSNVE